MEKTLNINAGSAILMKENSEIFSGYDSVNISAGSAVVSRKVYEKLAGMGISINSGNMKIIDVKGELAELPTNTVITGSMSFEGCYLMCDGNLIIEDVKGLEGITGLYAERLFHGGSVSVEGLANIEAAARITYPYDAKLHIGNMILDDTSRIILESGTQYWVHGSIKALSGDVLEDLQRRGIKFHCGRLITYNGLYESCKTMFTAEKYTLIPDGYTVAGDITLDSATSILHGEKLFVLGDMMIPHDQVQNLKGFLSLIVKGTATMPVTAAAEFKAIGKADSFELYEGVLLQINGVQTLGPEQCRSAIERNISYTLKVNGVLYFTSDVTAEDMDAIAALHCNGVISAPDHARGALDAKVTVINGTILDIDAMIKKFYGDKFTLGDNPLGALQKLMGQIQGGQEGSSINSGNFKL